MINIAVPITVWERPLITSFHFKWMDQFQRNCSKIGLNINPLYILSEDDSYLEGYKRRLKWGGHKHITVPSKRLSDKSQTAVNAVKQAFDVDWLMHLDSDEILSMELMRKWKEKMQIPSGPVWFGSQACYFVKTTGGGYEFLGYPDHPVKNGGTCIHRSVLEIIDWELWPFPRDMGLNVNERLHIEKHGYELQAFDMQEEYGVVEIKGGEAIHGMGWFEERDMLRELEGEELRGLVQHHPMLEFLMW